jgi:hypothetical protein
MTLMNGKIQMGMELGIMQIQMMIIMEMVSPISKNT